MTPSTRAAASTCGVELLPGGEVGDRQIRPQDLPHPGAGLRIVEGLLEQMAGLDDLDAEELQEAAEPCVLFARPLAEQDVVEEKLLHHRRHHAIDLRPGLVHEHTTKSADFRCHSDHFALPGSDYTLPGGRMSAIDGFDHPLAGRYASAEMLRLFSPRHRYTTWRHTWLALAEAEAELGLDIPDEALEQMRANLVVEDADLERVKGYEKKTRHDVMSHLHAFADRAPAARPVLHLGATSCFVADNAELMITRDALAIVEKRLLAVIAALASFAERWADEPTLGHTHFQPAQPTTVGKRACLWLQDLMLDLERLRFERSRLRARGVKGTTGTQATFLDLFEGDHERVRELDRRVATRLGFSADLPGYRTDLSAQGRRLRPRGALRNRPIGRQNDDRHPPPGPPQGGPGADGGGPGRFFRNALQGQPDALGDGSAPSPAGS